jgi:hypothetical protein
MLPQGTRCRLVPLWTPTAGGCYAVVAATRPRCDLHQHGGQNRWRLAVAATGWVRQMDRGSAPSADGHIPRIGLGVTLGAQQVTALNTVMSRHRHPPPHARGALSTGAFLLALASTEIASLTTAVAGPLATPPAPLDVALRYEATSDCPERKTFLDLVRLRAPHVRLLEPDPTRAPLLEVVVVLSKHPRGAAGRARISLDGKLRDERDFLGGSCLEVVRAAALSVAFALETRQAEAPALKPTAPKPTAPKTITPTPAPAAPKASQASRDPVQPSPAASTAHATPAAFRFDVGLAPVAASVLNKPWLLGGGLSLGARSVAGLRPSGGLSLLAAFSGESDRAASRYRWIVGQALLCPYRVGDEWSLSTCAHGLAGVMHAKGDAIDFPVDAAVSWFALGPSLKGSASIGSSIRLVAIVSASVPLAQRTFVFERPRRVVTQTQSVGWLVSVGVEHDIGGG